VSGAVHVDGVEAGIAEDNLDHALGGRIAFQNGLHVLV
jgi:hypothetical protein